MTKPMKRRDFVQSTAAAAAFTIVPRHVLGRGYRAPSDMLSVACIGVGGQGRSDVRGFSVEHLYALCDVDGESAEDSFQQFPDAKRYVDYREMLAREADHIDLVTVTIPDHSHASAALMALRAGKAVYCQKPLARTLGEVRAMRAEARRRPRQSTIMGNQGHAGDGTRLIREWVEAGAIGTVREVHYWTNRPIWPQALERPTDAHIPRPTMHWDLWLGPAPERPYHPAYAPFRWRGWWDFGTGALGDIACHAMDAAFWTLNLGYPTRITPESTTLYTETAPKSSRITYEFAARGGRGPITVVWRDGSLYPPRPPIVPAEVEWPPHNDGGQLWIGSDGMLTAGMYGQDPRLLDPERMRDITANPPPQKYPRLESVFAEMIAAVKAGTQPGSNWDGHAGPLTEMVLLGNLAVRSGRAIEVNPATGEVTTPGIPPEWLMPSYREGWTL